jgi:hypothetical protein
MPSLYGQSGNVTVNSSNTMGLYAIANTGNIVTANVSSVNTTGLYSRGGNVYVPSNAQQLLNLLSNNGTVIFQLDPAYADQKVEAFATGNGGGGGGNTIVNLVGDVTGLGSTGSAIYTTLSNTALNHYTGDITGNNITLTGNIKGNNVIVTTGIFYANGQAFISGGYGNANVAAYMPVYLPTYQANIGTTRTGNINTGNIYATNFTVFGNFKVTGNTQFSNVTTTITTTLLANANVPSTNTTTGTIISYGGVGVVGNLNVGGNINANLGTLAVGGNITSNSNAIVAGIYTDNYFYANGTPLAYSFYSNANAAAYLASGTDPTINNIYANLGLLTTEFTTLDANVGAFETYANAQIASTNANLSSYETYANAQIATLDANVGAFEIYANIFFGNLNANAAGQQTSINSINANLGAYQIYANANAASQATSINSINANIGAYETWANLSIAYGNTQINSISANLGSYQIYANANAAGQATSINTINANLGAFEIYANNTFLTSNTGYGNANVAAYLPYYAGNIGTFSLDGGTTAMYNVAIGYQAQTGVKPYALGDVAIGYGAAAGWPVQRSNNIAIGRESQADGGVSEISIGAYAGLNSSGDQNVFIGASAGQYAVGPNIISIGASAGGGDGSTPGSGPQPNTIAIGASAGQLNQVQGAIAIGYYAGETSQQTNAIAIGYYAGLTNQGNNSVAFGTNAGLTNQGNTSIAIGYHAGETNQSDQSIILNANGTPLNTSNSGFYVRPVRSDNANVAYSLYYNTTTNELTYSLTGTGGYGNANVAAYLPTDPNIKAIWGNINSINANIGSFETYANLQFNTINANIGSFETYANLQFNTINANIGSFETYANLQFNTINANVGAYQTYANANAASQQTSINSINANIGAFETYANATFQTSATAYGNANVAAYLPGYAGNLNAVYNLTASSIASTGNITSANGFFWSSNGQPYSVPFTGNLNGSVLYDSVNERIFANAYPLSTPINFPNSSLNNYIINAPVYTAGILQAPPSPFGNIATSGITIGLIQSANVLVANSTQTINNRNTLGTLNLLSITHTTNTTSQDRYRSMLGALDINLNGKTLGTMSTASQGQFNFQGLAGLTNVLGQGNIAAAIGVTGIVQVAPYGGTANVQYATGVMSTVNFSNPGALVPANIQYARLLSGTISGFNANSTVVNAVGLHTFSGWAGTIGSPTAGAENAYAILNEDASTIIQSAGNIVATSGAYFIGNGYYLTGITSGSSAYGNANVAAYLPTDPTFTGYLTYANANAATLATSISSINANLGAFETYANIFFGNLNANAATQAVSINSINANLGAFETYANLQFNTSFYSNTNVAAYIPVDPTFTGYLAYANVAFNTLQTEINIISAYGNTVSANLGAFETYANATFLTSSTGYGNANVSAYLPTDPNIKAVWGNINSINANLGAFETYANTAFATQANLTSFETYANATFGTSNYGNSNVAGYLPTYTGNLTAGNVVIAGNLTVQGNTTTINYNEYVAGQIVANATTPSTSTTTGAIVSDGGLGVAGNIYAGAIYSTGNLVTTNGIFWSNGTPYSAASNYGNTQVAAYLQNATASQGYIGSITNSPNMYTNAITANTILGPGSGTSNGTPFVIESTYGLTLKTDAANPVNIISTNGAFQGLQVAGNITANSSYYFIGDGSKLTNITSSYGNTQVAAYLLAPGPIGQTTPNSGSFAGLTATGATSLGNVTVTGNLTVNNQGTFSNVASTNGYFWANGTAYSTGGGSSFTGNLAGSTLYDSVNQRIFANAYPLSTPVATWNGNIFTNQIAVKPTYTGVVLNATSGAQTGQVVSEIISANINLAARGTATNTSTIGTLGYMQLWPQGATMNATDRVRGLQGIVELNLNGATWGNMTAAGANVSTIVSTSGLTQVVGTGSLGAAVGVLGGIIVVPVSGSANIQYATNFLSSTTYTNTNTPTASNISYARMLGGSITASGNLAVYNAVGLHTQLGWATATNKYVVLNEDPNSVIQTSGNVGVTGNIKMQAYQETVYATGITGGAVSINVSNGTIQSLTLTGNITSLAFTGMPAGGSVTLIITQGGSGSYTLTTSGIKYAGGNNTLSTAIGAIDILNVLFDGTTYYASLVNGYA